jgi:hypothetical protein
MDIHGGATLDKNEIYAALDPAWWLASTPNNWQTVFYSAVIKFTSGATTDCTYLSSAPFQTYGLNAGVSPAAGDVGTFINELRLEAAQRLFDLHCSAITGHEELANVYGASD